MQLRILKTSCLNQGSPLGKPEDIQMILGTKFYEELITQTYIEIAALKEENEENGTSKLNVEDM